MIHVIEGHHIVLADRLVLAYLTGNDDAYRITEDELGECPDCWRIIAKHLAGWLVSTMWQDKEKAAADIEADISEVLSADDDDDYGGL
jgi:hypothetical protein